MLETLDWLVERLDYETYLRKQDQADFRTRLEVLEEFRNACGDFDSNGGRGVDTFLQEISLSSDMDQGSPEQPSVTLMTCHSAKGLEFDHVFLIGLEEGLLPHGASFDDEVKLEEERRLCYVAMTRARETLRLSAARSRTLHGETKSRRVSRFIEALPETLLLRDAGEAAGPRAEGAASRVDAEKLKTGTRVRHAKFGNGTVMYKSGTGTAVKVRIRFDRGGARQFLVRATPLEIVQGARR